MPVVLGDERSVFADAQLFGGADFFTDRGNTLIDELRSRSRLTEEIRIWLHDEIVFKRCARIIFKRLLRNGGHKLIRF